MLQKKSMNKVMSLMGPTASGKTDLAIFLKKNFNIEIVSVDSVMFYKEFNIGSAKPDKETLIKFPHRMIDILEPYQKYSVAQFYDDLLIQIKDIHSIGKTPLLVGGSMMYFKIFFLGGLSDLKSVTIEIKNHVLKMFEDNDLLYLYNYLKKIDPVSAKKIHFNDKYRILRMLEIYFSNNKKPSDVLKKYSNTIQNFNNLNLSMIPTERKFLHVNIEERLSNMLDKGFIDEVEELREKYSDFSLPAMSTIGYKQASDYLKGEINYSVMRDNILAATRQLAKRQITWLRHLDASTVYTFLDYDNIVKRVKYFLSDK